MDTETDAPRCSTAPVAGRPVTVNGLPGALTALTVVALAPVLVKLTLIVFVPPTPISPKSNVDGLAVKPGLMP